MMMLDQEDGVQWLVTSAEYSLFYTCISHISTGARNVLPSFKMMSPEGVSLSLAFHCQTMDEHGYYCIDFHVEDLVKSGLWLEIRVSLVRFRRSSGCGFSTDKTQWPAPEPAIVTTLTDNGLAGSVPHHTTGFVTVKVEVFSLSPRPCHEILRGLNDTRAQGHLPDVVLTLDGHEFPAHRAVLAATSPVFLKMFSGDYKEAKALKKRDSGDLVCEVKISGVTKEAVELFLTLMYQGQADDWAGLEVELLEIADYYMVTHVKDKCERRLMGMDGPTALGLLRHADNPVISSDLRVCAVQAVVRGWKQLSITPQWRDLQKTRPVLVDFIRAAQQLYEQASSKPAQ
ncbi:kelch-like protein 24 [Thrips palmi]|uniref:Kelch-like protein 24 n=1 Tax=Thrips palmi TaxID=161013 RepID=A0A6P8YIB6_THRPL|nr:kelch-like protein 24 [Thrips palmi]XP_034236365.1 kelch-like protein 24 [Thrips palmi]XP_034236366.1 kelch-like protein 24 [Thrips palmi]XP_034236367.1 kelch-like protein 24 [Thrips palmi]XP_034236369.1 kelch-like protein 24 [Thrips palmi]XP_034236370.1 kelch-like protein 24 [Thrips palmi]XP_034236371.1 kelch-like protein 24 [Thrips palmi]XP_034236372.1 kelch-like protein 24 [Thrips palmi]